MMDILSRKEIIKCATLGIPKEMQKCNFYFFCFNFTIDILIRNENIGLEEHKTKNCLK